MEIYGSIKLKGSLADGTGDPLLTKDASTSEVGTTTNAFGNLQDGSILVGNASNEPTAVSVSGDITLSNTGVAAIASGVIVDSDIHASAAISVSKLATITASRAIVTDANGFLTASSVTSTELGYVSGVTSPIQTQLNSKQATITGAATTITSSNLTASRALIANSSGKVAVSSVTDTQLGYLSTTTSNVQTQLNSKLSATISSVATGDIIYYNGTNWVNLPRGTNGQALYSTATSIQWDTPTINGIPIGGTANQVLAKQSGTDFDADWETLSVSSITDLTATAAELNVLDGITATTTELNYVDGVSGPIQTQLDGKQSSTLPQNAIWIGNSSNLAATLSAGSDGYVLTSVSGVPTWQPVSASGTPPGSNTQIIFNDGGSFGTDAGLTYDKTTDLLSVSGTATISTDNASNSSVTTVLSLVHTTSGSPAIGIGTGLSFTTETSAGNEIGSSIESVTTSVASGNEYFDLVLNTMGQGTLGEAFRLSRLAGPTTRITAQSSTIDVTSSGWQFNNQLLVNSSFKVGVNQDATPDRKLHTEEYSTATNTVLYPFRMSRVVQSGSGAAGIGVGMEFEVENGSGTNVVGSTIEAVTTDVTATSEDFDLVFKTMSAGATASERLRVTSDGRIYGTALHNNSGSVTGTTNQYICSGTYTPTLTSVTNVASSLAYECMYTRVGNVVSVSGKVSITPTASGTDTSLGMSLPIASDFVNDYSCAGAAYNRDVNRDVGCAIIGDATNNRAEFVLKPSTTNIRLYYFTFSYIVL